MGAVITHLTGSCEVVVAAQVVEQKILDRVFGCILAACEKISQYCCLEQSASAPFPTKDKIRTRICSFRYGFCKTCDAISFITLC